MMMQKGDVVSKEVRLCSEAKEIYQATQPTLRTTRKITMEVIMARMSVVPAAAIAAMLTLGNNAGAEIQKPDPLPCKQFVKDADGFWSPKTQIKMIQGGVPVTIGPGLRVRPGALIIGLEGGLDLGAALEAECGAGAPT